jgi:mannan endo-1,4-beta-mannosidase
MSKLSIAIRPYKNIKVLLVVIIIAAIGTYIIQESHAATPYASLDASTGTLSGSAQTFTDATASNGTAVRFGATITGSNPTGKFYIVGDKIVDPDGNIYLPIGANVGMHPNNFDWAGTALGHSTQAQEWGWNTIRLNVECTTAESYSNVTAAAGDTVLLKYIDQVVQEYTAKHIVVIVECHDAQKDPAQATTFWTDMANKYKDNTYVWFNYANEPDYENQTQWVSDQETWLKTVRSTGAENIFVADTLNAGNDAGWGGTQKVYTPDVGPAVEAGQCNVLFSLHNYGGQANSQDYIMRPQVYETYWQNVQAAGLAMIVGEFGMDYRLAFQTQSDGSVKVVATDGVSDPAKIAGDVYNHVANGEYATINYANKYGIGMLAWHATFADDYRLATPINGITLADGSSSGEPNFYNILNSSGTGLQSGFTFTQEGADLWKVSHNQPNLGKFTGNYADSNCTSAK